MANETTLIFETELPIPFTVADGTGIEKGALLKLTDPMTAIINSALYDQCAGIASTEKIANDGVTKLGVFRRGIFKAIASGSISAGDSLGLATNSGSFVNYLCKSNSIFSGSAIVGYSLESCTEGETFLFELNIGCGVGY